MIGISVRGFRHLWRLSEPSIREMIINFRDGGYQLCHIVKTHKESLLGEKLIIFNNVTQFGNISLNSVLSCLNKSEMATIQNRYRRVIAIDNYGYEPIMSYIYEMILLPKDFNSEYDKFISANAKMLKSLTGKYGYGLDQDISKLIFACTTGSKNFYQWAIGAYFHGICLSTIKKIMLWNEIYGQMAKNLKKNTITAYTSNSDIVALSEELRILRREKRSNDAINMFNTVQKRILKSVDLTDKDKEVLSKFYRLSEAKKINFVRKVSTIENFDELMRQLRHITSTHFEWNKESFMDFITNVEGMKYETVFDNNSVVVIKVYDYETVKNLAKTTNWCISKNKTYWNQYVEDKMETTQYVLFDFSKKEDDLLSIIGFTTEYNKGITHAHDFSNNDIMKSDTNSESQFLNSFISNFKNTDGIYNVLKNCGVDITIIAQYDKPLYEWNREAIYEHLYNCVKKGNVDIFRDEVDQIVVSVKDENIRYFLGDAYVDNISSENWNAQHIIFMDLSLSEYDPNRIQFAIIKHFDFEGEDVCVGIYNEHADAMNVSFDAKLNQYHLPYNIIRRSDNINARLEGALYSSNAPLIKELISKVPQSVLEDVIHDDIGAEAMLHRISSSILKSMSFDLLDAFYENGIKLNDIFGTDYMCPFFKAITREFIRKGAISGSNFKTPTEDEIGRFFASNCSTIDNAFYIGMYLTLKKMIKNESGGHQTNVLFGSIIAEIHASGASGETIEDILMDIAPKFNFAEIRKTIEFWLEYAYRHGSDNMKEYTVKNVLIHTFPRSIWESMSCKKPAPQESPRLTLPLDFDYFAEFDEENAGEDAEIYAEAPGGQF